MALRILGLSGLGALLIWPQISTAQSYRFPTSETHYDYFYPTAYYDHSGLDWACGSDTYSGHRGSDFGVGGFDGMDAGRDIVAAAGGSVLTAHDGEYDRCTSGACSGGGGFGNYVKLQHADGHQTIYAHMKEWSVTVSEGQWVECGEKLGEVGSSGYSTGPHLHFEVRDENESALDPFEGDCSDDESVWVEQGSYGSLPAPSCDGETEACEPVDLLTCGDTVTSNNTAAGATNTHWFYGCTSWIYSGSEIAYRFQTDRDEPVEVHVTGLSGDLDLYALESTACDGSGCLDSSSNSETSDETLSFSAVAGEETVLVIDGWDGAESDFSLTIECDGQLPVTEDTGDTGISLGDTGTDRPTTRPPKNTQSAGCACSTSNDGRAPGWLYATALLAFIGRRRSAFGP